VNWLVHLVTADEWPTDATEIVPPSLAQVGFVHLSTPAQVAIPANLFYTGLDVVLLWVDPELVGDEIRFEEGDPPVPGQVFPHLYGPLPVAAVVAATPYRPGPDGQYSAPDAP